MTHKIYAAAYAHLGWCVLPLHSINSGRCTCGRVGCPSPGKHPLNSDGVKGATRSQAQIKAWWERWPSANIGVACGATSGMFVLDIDGEAGEESLSDLELAHGPLPATVEQLTGGGGRHVLFKRPGTRITNKVAIAPGLDIRGDGGYIVVAPSVHVSGRRYQWELSSLPSKTPLADAPAWLLKLARPATPRKGGQPVDEWAKLSGLPAPKGERNARLAKLAGLLLRRYVPVPVVQEMLQAWNATKCLPPLSRQEVHRIVASVAASEERRRQVAGAKTLTATVGG